MFSRISFSHSEEEIPIHSFLVTLCKTLKLQKCSHVFPCDTKICWQGCAFLLHVCSRSGFHPLHTNSLSSPSLSTIDVLFHFPWYNHRSRDLKHFKAGLVSDMDYALLSRNREALWSHKIWILIGLVHIKKQVSTPPEDAGKKRRAPVTMVNVAKLIWEGGSSWETTSRKANTKFNPQEAVVLKRGSAPETKPKERDTQLLWPRHCPCITAELSVWSAEALPPHMFLWLTKCDMLCLCSRWGKEGRDKGAK